MKTFKLYLDLGDNGACNAHVLELLGANVLASNKHRAFEKIKLEIPEYSNWLRKFGEQQELPMDKFDIEVAEVVHGTDPWNAGGANALFGTDKVLPTEKQIHIYLKRMGYSRIHLLDLVRDLPQSALNEEYENEPRSIKNTLKHIADVEWWYLSRMGTDPEIDLEGFPDIFDRLKYMRNYAEESLRSISHEELKRINIPSRYTSPQQERLQEAWTWHKVFRRFLEHERLHTRYIERILRTYHRN
ncbi:MAG: DinB family protein [Thermoplasmata archaeon]|nr:MAG: DinB family protein [Thermoplasmata archaeon]